MAKQSITIIASPQARHQLTHQEVLAEGLRLLGHDVVLASTHHGAIRTECVACWGWHTGQVHKIQGRRVLVMERGYLGDRFAYTSLAWDGLNGFGEFPKFTPDSGKRFNTMSKMLPWKSEGKYSLILGQVPGDASLRGKNMMPWYEEQARQAKAAFGLPVLFRPHPQALKRGIKQEPAGTILCTAESLEEALSDAAVAITYNSNSGVDAVLAGVPTVAEDEGSMAYAVASRSVHGIVMPDRARWAYDLAYKQWSLDEIRSGEALKGLF